ncbi:MAG TPA: S9 family peptidase [Allosphingosinicella sp.]|nr:S9 family peptidase [Allosphingosinicella sp.]
MRRLSVATAAALFLICAGPAAARPFTAKDLAMMERVSSPRLSPDGRFLAHIVRTTDWEGNGGVNALHVVDLNADASKPRVLLGGEKGGLSPRWSSDGKWLYFLSAKSGSPQVWRSNADGSVRRQLTAFPVGVAAFRLGPDNRTLYVAVDSYADCPTLACIKARDDDKAKQKSTGVHIKSGPNRFWDAYEDEKALGLYRVDLDQEGAPAEALRVVNGFAADVPAAGDDSNIVVSRDGRTLYFASRDPAVEQGGQAFARLYAVPADGSAPPRLVIGQPGTSISRPVLSPDGTRLAYLAIAQPTWTYGRTAVMVMDLKSGRSREVAPSLDASLGRLAWSNDGRKLLATGEERGQAPLYEIDAATGQVTKLTADGQVTEFDMAGGRIAYVRESLESPQQIFVRQPGSAPRQITRAGASILAETPLSPSEQFSFPGWKGETVYGYVTKPHGYVEGQKYPVAFLIHGGPHGSFGNAWSYRWNPQVWAGMGYAVVSVDFHGSSGYGEEFGRSILNHWGDIPLEDLQKGWAHALSRYTYLDGNRACALGGSYGGYMVSWIASQWNEAWKCLVNHAGVFDVRTQGWSMDITSFVDVQSGGSPTMEDLERFNPALHVSRWKVPMLVIHGAKDYRVPLDQGIAAHNAARRAGVPTEFLLFPDENHWILKPQNSVQWYQVVENWLDRWTGGNPAPK